MRVATSPAFLEAIANDPRVRPALGGEGEFRCTTWAGTVALEWDEGGIVFRPEWPGVYSAHWLFLPHTKDVLGKASEALAYLFTHTDAAKVIGQTPLHLKHAIRAARNAGMRHIADLQGHSLSEMTRQEWNQRQRTDT